MEKTDFFDRFISGLEKTRLEEIASEEIKGGASDSFAAINPMLCEVINNGVRCHANAGSCNPNNGISTLMTCPIPPVEPYRSKL